MSGYDEFSKKRLLNNLEKKFNTTIIGSLAIFEEQFGFMWGHGIPYSSLSKEQKELRIIWKETRTKILDSGNSNLRAAQSELAQYSFTWNRFITNFKLDKENQEN
jgi:hypothetical protein